MGRKICLSLGVSVVKPGANGQSGFAILDGAIVAAKCLGAWAVAAGFDPANVAVVTDERTAGPVTTETVRGAVAGLFQAGAEPVDHLVLSFCGHGLTGAELGSTFWLLSDALEEQYRVNVDFFVGELLKYGIQRITLISDACRDGPANLDLQRFDGRRVINGPAQSVKSPQFDRLAACQDGKTAFMVGNRGSALPGKCIFSGVVADILWKREATAIVDGAITTLGLGAIARSRATERAKDYLLELYPQCLVDPLPATLVGATQNLPPEARPQAWPPVGQGQAMGHVDLDQVEAPEVATPEIALERISAEPGFRDEILGAGFGQSVPDLDFSRNFSGFPKNAAGPLFNLIKLRSVSRTDDTDDETRAMADDRADQAVKQLEAAAAVQARQKVAAEFRQRDEFFNLPWEMRRADLVCLNTEIFAVYGDAGMSVARLEGQTDNLTAWRISSRRAHRTIVVETADRILVPVTLYRRLFATISPDPRGGYVVAYGNEYNPGGIERAFHSIAELAAGNLSPDALDDLAAHLRYDKHVDPVQGVIAAYLYKAVADCDSIRRMAYFYRQHDQAVPFDIALLGDIPVTRARNGSLVAHVPEVPARDGPRRGLPSWVVRATPGTDVTIGGVMPWLSIGWDYVSDPAPEWATLVNRIVPFSRDVVRSGFTNLPAERAPEVTKRLKLRRLRIVGQARG